MAQSVEGKRVAILAADGFEESELFSPKEAIERAGGYVDVISVKPGDIQGLRHMQPGKTIHVDHTIEEADPSDYDAILIPGGVFSPDALRTKREALKFTADFMQHKKPVFAICHGPQVLISARLVGGRKMTAVEAVRCDLENAGAQVKDEPVVVDHGLVTSRTPDDLEAFNNALLQELASDDQDRHPDHKPWTIF